MKFTSVMALALSASNAFALYNYEAELGLKQNNHLKRADDNDDKAAIEAANPLKDDFYDKPNDYESKKPGEILRNRKAPVKLTFENYTEAYQLMYRTTDSLNNATYTWTTVVVPENANKDHFISYQYAEDSSYLPCAPSYTMVTDDADKVGQQFLNQGNILVIPDYQGPGSAFTAGILSGHAVLDSIRAVLGFEELGLKDAKYAMYGYSGGSLASGWAAELQPDYAPELDIAGVAVGGFISNVTEVALNSNGKLTSGFIPAGLVGLSSEYPAIESLLKNDMFSANSSKFMKASEQCVTADLMMFLQQDIFSYFKGGEDVLYKEDVQAVMKNLTMAQEKRVPKAPMFVFEAINDEVAPIKMVDETIKTYCDNGADIAYFKLPGKTHTSGAENGTAAGYEWLMERLAGKKVSKGCSTKTTLFPAMSLSTSAASGGKNATSTKSSGSNKPSSTTSSGSKSSATTSSGDSNSAAPANAVTSLLAVPFLIALFV